jgi:Holliday junction resolvasome RuvABC endonuclease subunit
MFEVVGIDISLNNIGVFRATVDASGNVMNKGVALIQPPKADASTKKQVRKNSDDLRRARWLHDGLHKAIEGANVVCVEMPVGSQSARAMASYGICVGVLSSLKVAMIEVTPTDVKLAGVGTKTASKQEMIQWATDKHPEAEWKTMKRNGGVVLTNDNEHIADACAAIYAGMKTAEFKAMVSMIESLRVAV